MRHTATLTASLVYAITVAAAVQELQFETASIKANKSGPTGISWPSASVC